jgi:hypothetical protein
MPCGANVARRGVTLKPIPAFPSVGGGRLATPRAVPSNLSAPPPLGVLSGETLFVDRGVILLQQVHTRLLSSVSNSHQLLSVSLRQTSPAPG